MGAIGEPYRKVIISGNIVEVYSMEKQPINPHDLKDRHDMFSQHLEDTSLLALNPETRDKSIKDMRNRLRCDVALRGDRRRERREQTLRDARNDCRRLANMNFDNRSLFITLTMRDQIEDVETGDKMFKDFIKRFRRKFGKFGYLAVREWMKNGRIHYHMICDANITWRNDEHLKHIERMFGEPGGIWGNGFVDIQRMDRTKDGKNVDNVGAYLIKYMTKHVDDVRLKHKKSYLCSQGLLRPTVLTDLVAEEFLYNFAYNNKKEVFTNSYESEYLGLITYREYNLDRDTQ